MKKLALIMAVVMVLSFGLAGCAAPAAPAASTPATGSGSDVTSASTAASEVNTFEGPKEVVINLVSEPPEMNSILTTSSGSMNVLRHIMDGLTILDQTDEPIPGIAESWDISEDNLTYTFHLRKDAKWSNGEPVTAKDFIFAWNQLFTAENAAEYASVWAGYIQGATEMLDNGTSAEGVGYKAIDDYTIELVLTRPCTYILSVLAFPNFMPLNEAAYTEMGGVEAYGTEPENFLTNGAFLVDSWTHEESFVIAKNPDYYAADTINLDKIEFAMISDSTTGYNGFVNGELDMIALTSDQIEMANAAGYTVESFDDGSCWYFEFNTLTPGMSNAKIRTAITMAIDAESFVKNVVKNSSIPAYSFTPPAVMQGAFTDSVGKLMDREGYAADNYAKARALLAEGLAEENMTMEDLKLSIVIDDTSTATKYVAFFQEQLKTNLGLEVTAEQMTYKARLEQMANKSFNGIVSAGWSPDYNDPMSFLDLWISTNGNNHTSWANPEYDKLIADATAETDVAKRLAILVEAEKLLISEMPIGPIWNRKIDYVVSERLTGVVRTAYDDTNLRWADVVA